MLGIIICQSWQIFQMETSHVSITYLLGSGLATSTDCAQTPEIRPLRSSQDISLLHHFCAAKNKIPIPATFSTPKSNLSLLCISRLGNYCFLLSKYLALPSSLLFNGKMILLVCWDGKYFKKKKVITNYSLLIIYPILWQLLQVFQEPDSEM